MSNTSSQVLNSDENHEHHELQDSVLLDARAGERRRALERESASPSKAKARERLIEAGKVMLDAVLEAWREE